MFWQEEDLLSDQYPGGQTETLQTDIQRFIAILGFCLMAIFALVQAIPVTAPEKNPRIEDLSHEVDLQKVELSLLKSENKRLKSEIDHLSLKETKPKTGPLEPGEESGFYVAFESDQVFLTLLESEKIRLYIRVSGMESGFKVLKKGGNLKFVSGPLVQGLDLWEIKEAMVPNQILDKFRAWTTLSSREKIFIIGMTDEISRQIREKEKRNGRLIIKEGGGVSYRPFTG